MSHLSSEASGASSIEPFVLASLFGRYFSTASPKSLAVSSLFSSASAMLLLRAFSQWHSVFSQWLEFSPSPSTSDLRVSSIFTTSRVRGHDDGPRLHRSLLLNDRFHGLARLLLDCPWGRFQ